MTTVNKTKLVKISLRLGPNDIRHHFGSETQLLRLLNGGQDDQTWIAFERSGQKVCVYRPWTSGRCRWFDSMAEAKKYIQAQVTKAGIQ